MAVRVVVGRAGSGKSAGCFARVVGLMRAEPLGRPVYWVVPRQATFSTQRWLTCGSGLKAMARCRVVSFESLAEEVLEELGGGKRAVVSRAGRMMVVGHLLRKHEAELKHFKASARTPGLARDLMGLMDEIGRNAGGDAGTALTAAVDSLDRLGGDASRGLARKLGDLEFLRTRYAEFMGGGGVGGGAAARFDKDARMELVLSRLGACGRFRGATVIVDGFLDLLDFERRMIVALTGVAADVEVTFCLPDDSPLLDGRAIHNYPADDSVFHRVEMAHRALRLMLAERQIPVEVVRLGQTPAASSSHRLRKGSLRLLEAALAGRNVTRDVTRDDAPTDAVRLIEAPDVRSEVDAVAREILRATRSRGGGGGEGGRRFRDFVVLTRDAARYEASIAASFREHGISFFLDRRPDASCHPLLRLLRSVLSIATAGWSTEQVVSICKGGLAGGEPQVACRLENWAVAKGLRGEAWVAPHPHNKDTEVEALRDRVVQALRGVVDGLRAGAGISIADACTRLLSMFETLGVRKTLAAWMRSADDAGDHEGRAEHAQVWGEVMTLLDELTDLLGPATVTAAEFQTVLLSGLEGLDLGLTPPTVDGVLVGTADRTRPGDAKIAIVLGLSDGIFPQAHTTEDLLSDAERRQLRKLDLPVDPDGERRQLDERLLGYLALTRASEQLILTRPTADARGAELAPGAFWDLVHRTLPAVPVEKARSESDARPDDVATPRQLTVGLLRWARDPLLRNDPDVGPVWARLYRFLAACPTDDSPLDVCRHAVWSALARKNDAALSPETAAALWPLPLKATDDQIESFAACPFQHFLEFGLRLQTVVGPEVTYGRVSGVLHRVLGRLCDDIVRDGGRWPSLTEDQTAGRLAEISHEAIAHEVKRLTWDGSADESRLTPRDRFLLSRVSSLVSQVVRAHQAAAVRTHFVPARAGVKFGDGSRDNIPPLRVALTVNGGTPGEVPGSEVLISGSIDRVDTTPGGNRVVAWDYGWSGAGDSLGRMYHGLAVKVLVHLLVLRDHPADVAGSPSAVASGAFAVGLSAKVESHSSIEKWQSAPAVDSDDFQLRRRRGKGVLNADHLSDLDSGLAEGSGASPMFSVSLNKDGSIRRGASDALTSEQIARLLDHAEQKIAEVARGIAEGVISIRPYMLGRDTPCPRCDYRRVCRFDTRNGGTYLFLDTVDVRNALSGEAHDPPLAPPPEPAPKKPAARVRGAKGGAP